MPSQDTYPELKTQDVLDLLNTEGIGQRARGANQSKVYLFPDNSPPVAIKTPTGKGLWRWVSRFIIQREHEIYRILEMVPRVPHCYGLFQGQYLVIEYQPGGKTRREATSVAPGTTSPSEPVAGLRKTIATMHRCGIAHADLKRPDNVIHTPDNRLVVIDFGTALKRRTARGGPLWRWAAQQDWNAWAHYGWGKDPQLMPPAVARLYQRTFLERIAKTLRRAYKRVRGID
ncbi:serine/threonine-protein kinase [Halorhodospira halochloris]|uniref:non-specific serine/threonine protein kinase n=1 Tax=Halorhodospira halochloris TaxID=1052 RepID=A0A0X8X6J5_HALHR|nr:serine/threonine-protein kinase [Halorhodospira halochloris]MBK1650931.1 hypothetical protein [Halorhodospira halochloris]MCG5529297.1 serine/threonine-protein kinase [Halorhodospira halochloris]BAU56565.2 hypothetical protein HH1059_24890 [Halorhodospira halochloris]